MFIRFVCGEIDERSHVAGGLFCATLQLYETEYIPEYELEAAGEIVYWLNRNMDSPFDYLPEVARFDPAICWFKFWTIKSHRTGYVYYEDEVQVFARPDRDVRRQL